MTMIRACLLLPPLFAFFVTSQMVARAQPSELPLRVFIFAGQSNMVGSDSNVADVERFPPFAGLESAQPQVRYSYCIGRENKERSKGWVNLAPVNKIVGPELSFARRVTQNSPGPIAIIKCAAGGTHLGGDWNPDDPIGFEMYPVLIDLVRDSLQQLEKQNIAYRLEGFMWHQGENDMFDDEYMNNYGRNLTHFMTCVRRDLNAQDLNFYIGELCTKTIWGMDLRPKMHAISLGQKEAVAADPIAHYVPTSHIGVEIGSGVGLHYHYGTLGQLQHGLNYATSYLQSIGHSTARSRTLTQWPYPKTSKVKLFLLVGHRNMEGERAFVQHLANLPEGESLLGDNQSVAFQFSLGGGYQVSDGWEPMGATGYYDTFGPELSFVARLQETMTTPIAIAKYTHSGSQIIDWTPAGSEAASRNLYSSFIEFAKQSIQDLEDRGHDVELAGVFYHLGENDMSFMPYRRAAAERVRSLVETSRVDLAMPELDWFISQQSPTRSNDLDKIDVLAEIAMLAKTDTHLHHVRAVDLPEQPKQIVLNAEGIVALGQLLADSYLKQLE